MEILCLSQTGEHFCEESNVEECLQFLSKEFLSLGIIGIKDMEEFNHTYGNNENINCINKNIINNDNKSTKNLNYMEKNNDTIMQIQINDIKNLDNSSVHKKDFGNFNRASYKDIVWVINNSYKSLIRLRKFHEVKIRLQDINTKIMSELTQSRGECNRWKEKVEGMNRELGVMEVKNGLLKEKVAMLEKEGRKERNEIRSLRAELSRSEDKSKVIIGKLQRQLDVLVTRVGFGLKSDEDFSAYNFPKKKIYGRKNVVCSRRDVSDSKKNKEVLEKVVAIKVKSFAEKNNIARYDNNSKALKQKVSLHTFKQCSNASKHASYVKTASMQSSFTKASFVHKSSPKPQITSFNVKKTVHCPGTYKKNKNAIKNENIKTDDKDKICNLSVSTIEQNRSQSKNDSDVSGYSIDPESNDYIKVHLFESNKVGIEIADVIKDDKDNIVDEVSEEVKKESLLNNEDQITKNGKDDDDEINDNKDEKEKSLKDVIICGFVEIKNENSKQCDYKDKVDVDDFDEDFDDDYDEDGNDDFDEDGNDDYDEDDDYEEDDVESDDDDDNADVGTRPGPLIRSSSYTILKHDDKGDKRPQNSPTTT